MQKPVVNVMVKAARAAGNVLLRGMHKLDAISVVEKDRMDFASEMDEEAEKAAIKELRRAHPDYAILGEELELRLPASAFRYFTRFDFDLTFAGRGTIWRYFYEVELPASRLSELRLQEGSGMRLFPAEDILLGAVQITPYDAFALWFHINRERLQA